MFVSDPSDSSVEAGTSAGKRTNPAMFWETKFPRRQKRRYLVYGDPPGSFELCPICNWQDDIAQLRFPTYTPSTNDMSLVEAQTNVPLPLQKQDRLRTNAANLRSLYDKVVVIPHGAGTYSSTPISTMDTTLGWLGSSNRVSPSMSRRGAFTLEPASMHGEPAVNR